MISKWIRRILSKSPVDEDVVGMSGLSKPDQACQPTSEGIAGEKHDLILVALSQDQICRAREANGKRKRITHVLVCGPYGQFFGTEKQCLKYWSVWTETFPSLFGRAVRLDAYELSDYLTTFDLVNILMDLEEDEESFDLKQEQASVGISTEREGSIALGEEVQAANLELDSSRPTITRRHAKRGSLKAREFLANSPPNTFNVIDVETANSDWSSVCQIGLVQVRNGRIEDTWETLVNPEEWFDPWNVSVHGITSEAVKAAPTLPEVERDLYRRLRDSVLVSHTAFDRVAMERVMDKYHLPRLGVVWLDSARIVRRAWPEKFGQRGYGLSSVANDLEISFRHHDALEDALAAAKIVLRACEDTGLDIEAWLYRVESRIQQGKHLRSVRHESFSKDGNPEGQLFGEVVVFTGSLNLPREKVTHLAAYAGCKVRTTISRRTSMLVVGLQDRKRLNGYEKSSKHRKAEQLMSEGVDIQILSESDFLRVIS